MTKKMGGRGECLGSQGGCKWRIEVMLKIPKTKWGGRVWGGGSGMVGLGGVGSGGRVFEKIQKRRGGSGEEGWGSQGGCEWRIEVFVKIQKKSGDGGRVGGGGGGWGESGRVRGGSGWMWTKNWSFCENSKNKIGGGGRGLSGWGVRVDVNGELKFF